MRSTLFVYILLCALVIGLFVDGKSVSSNLTDHSQTSNKDLENYLKDLIQNGPEEERTLAMYLLKNNDNDITADQLKEYIDENTNKEPEHYNKDNGKEDNDGDNTINGNNFREKDEQTEQEELIRNKLQKDIEKINKHNFNKEEDKNNVNENKILSVGFEESNKTDDDGQSHVDTKMSNDKGSREKDTHDDEEKTKSGEINRKQSDNKNNNNYVNDNYKNDNKKTNVIKETEEQEIPETEDVEKEINQTPDINNRLAQNVNQSIQVKETSELETENSNILTEINTQIEYSTESFKYTTESTGLVTDNNNHISLYEDTDKETYNETITNTDAETENPSNQTAKSVDKTTASNTQISKLNKTLAEDNRNITQELTDNNNNIVEPSEQTTQRENGIYVTENESQIASDTIKNITEPKVYSIERGANIKKNNTNVVQTTGTVVQNPTPTDNSTSIEIQTTEPNDQVNEITNIPEETDNQTSTTTGNTREMGHEITENANQTKTKEIDHQITDSDTPHPERMEITQTTTNVSETITAPVIYIEQSTTINSQDIKYKKPKGVARNQVEFGDNLEENQVSDLEETSTPCHMFTTGGRYDGSAVVAAAVGGVFIGGVVVFLLFYFKQKCNKYLNGDYRRVPMEYDFELNPRLKTHSF